MKKSLFTITALFCLVSYSLAQGYIELLNTQYEYFPLKLKNSTFSGSRIALNVTVPIVLASEKKRYILLGLNTEQIMFYDSPQGYAVNRFYGISPTLAYTTALSDKVKITAAILPFLNSDFEKIESIDINWGGIIRFVKLMTPLLSGRLTLGYRQQFFGPQYIVLVGFDWQVNERLRIWGDFPQSVVLSYKTSEKTRIGLMETANLTSFNLISNKYFRYNYTYGGAFFEYYVTKQLALRTNLEYAFTRKFDIFKDGDAPKNTLVFFQLGDKPPPLSCPLSKGVVWRLALSYRLAQSP